MVCPENGFELFEPEGFDEDEQPATSTAAIAAVTSTSGIRFFLRDIDGSISVWSLGRGIRRGRARESGGSQVAKMPSSGGRVIWHYASFDARLRRCGSQFS